MVQQRIMRWIALQIFNVKASKKERERERMNSATIMVKPTASSEGLMLVRNIAGDPIQVYMTSRSAPCDV